MTVVIPFAQADVRQAIDLIDWIKLLGGADKYRCLLVADAAVGWVDGMAAKQAADKVFKSVEIITNEKSVVGWPEGANSLFFTAAKHITDDCWLWLEPDALPLRAGWLEAIASAYQAQGSPFMGHVYPNKKPEFPRRVMSGIAVYPADAIKGGLFEVQAVAWDMHHAEMLVANGTPTPLIYHFWGQKDLSPTFSEFKTVNSPINEMTLENIPKGAVIYHRCKDGSLLRLLKRKMFPDLCAPEGKLLAVLGFCGKDVELAQRNMEWMHELGGVKKFPCLLSYDDYTNKQKVTAIRKLAEKTFEEVKVNAYRARTDLGWPHGPNLAFQATARFAQANYKIPWLWIEADAVPIKPQWLDVICSEYYRHGKSFYAPIVPRLNHQNGVGVYAWNTASRCPKMMTCTNTAWDFAGMQDTIHDRADAESYIQHVWGEVDGKPHPTEGEAMRWESIDQVKRHIHPEACLFHRAKDNSLIERLREMRNRQ
jgi:hypothetical protein